MPADSPDAWVLGSKNVIVHLYSFVLFSILCTLCSASKDDCVKVSDTLKLELQTTVNCHMVAGSWTLVLGNSSTLNQWAISPAPAAKDNNLFTSVLHRDFSHLQSLILLLLLRTSRTNKALQSHNSTGMVLCKSFNINLENGEVLLLETHVVPFHSHLQMELCKGIRHEGGSHLSTTLSAKLDLTL